MSSSSSGSGTGGSVLPDWISQLKPLTSVVGTLVALGFYLGNDPIEALRLFVLDVVLRWFLGGILAFLTGVVGLILDAVSDVASIPVKIAGLVVDLASALGVPVLGGLDALASMVGMIVGAAGPLAPVLLAVVAYVVVRVLLEAIRVLGTYFTGGLLNRLLGGFL